MDTTTPQIGFSYYELTLLSLLRESFPDKASDIDFVKTRAEAATEAYEAAFEREEPLPQCRETALRTLFEGFYFSKYDLLVRILWEEFAKEVSPAVAREVALRLLPLCEETFSGYPLSDDFADSPDYERLYTELTGTVQLILERDGSL